ncbi:TonB-dependent Receptor Plug Domain [Fodinibius roseus]|uniref:TonB-dependent Receptor Plug Domain n=2 Tax=Fodinibius roseus TaxID=1194090 RepID=A0A1M4XJH0_9BACT|nr:TonB-dependent Receptor Plug Domain [Fodinibius roseus]
MDALRSFTLRGLSPDHTLVLINGKRRHKSALINRLGSGIQKGSSPVDMNAIPASAVKQMEVLRDGAAAQYGSDAIAGVVNIELRDEPVPFSVGYKVGNHATDDFSNDGTTHDINAAYGFSVGDEGYINLFGEMRMREPTNRAGADPRDQVEEGDADEVLVNAAGRFESYSDFGETLTGKLALRYQPQEELIFRGAVSTGFRAPNLAQRYFSKISTTFIDNVPYEVGLFNNASDVADVLGVPDLKEEKSFNASGGLAVSPTDNLTFTVDIFHIDIEDRIILSGNLSGPEIENLVSEFGAQRVQVFSNAVDTRTWGIDLTASYRTLVGDQGSLLLKGALNTTRNRLVSGVRTPSQLDESFGESIFGREARLELEKERPKNTLNLEATYDNGPFSFSAISKRYGEVLVPDNDPAQDYTLSEEWVINMSASYEVVEDYATLMVGARNLLDNYPDLTPSHSNFLGIFPYPTASPMGFNGRYLYSKLSITF